MKKAKRLLAISLALVIVVSMFAVLGTLSASAVDAEPIITCDFSNYTIGGTNVPAGGNWSIDATDGDEALLGDFTSGSLKAYNFGFIICDNSLTDGKYAWGVSGPMAPGTIYKIEFKAKADNDCTMDYAIYNAYSYAASSRDDHNVNYVYDAFGRRTAEVTTEWQDFTSYFTADSYPNTGSQGTNRPFFFIQPNDTVWSNYVYFDDIVITPCTGLSFCESANHYYEPTVGNTGDSVTLIEDPELEGYTFDGWYVDEERVTPLGNDAKIGDYAVVYSKWTEGSEPGECEHTGGTATCHSKAVCTLCGEEYGEFDANNHDGGTEVRDAVAATETEDGYTGDTYCLGCGAKIATGEVIPATGAGTEAIITCDFSNYTIGGTNVEPGSNWSIDATGDSEVLLGDFTNGNLKAYNFGFIICDNSLTDGKYSWGTNGPMVPGTIYKIEFKAKADNDCTMEYAIYNGYSYVASSRDDHNVNYVYDAFGRRTAEITTEWQDFTSYFTADSYPNKGGQGTNRPFFFIQPNDTVWSNYIYFDDIVITPCTGLSFCESANHYYEPTVGNTGDSVTLIEDPELEGYSFDGWYVDEDRVTPLGSDAKIGDYAVVYSKWAEETYVSGDINGDAELNNKDLTRFFQYLSDWDVEVNEAALDVNGDGAVNNKDLTRLFQYLSDWDVEIF